MLLECPNCGSTDLNKTYVRIKCNKCLMTGPQMNGGINDDHVDHIDGERAEKLWNDLPRRNK